MATTVTTRAPSSLNPTRQQLDELDALLQRMLELPVNSYEDSSLVEQESSLDEEMDEEEMAPPPAPMEAAPPPAPPPRPTPPISYMVVETASPRPLPAASGFEMRPTAPSMRLVPLSQEEEHAIDEQAQAAATAIDPPAPEGEMWVPLRSTWQPSPQTWPPLADSWHQASGTLPTPAAATPKPQPPVMPKEIAIEVPREVMPPPTPPTPPAPPPIAEEPRLSLSAEDVPPPPPSWLLPLVWFNQGFDACLAPLGAPGRWLCSHRGRQLLGALGVAGLAAAAALAVSAGMGWSW